MNRACADAIDACQEALRPEKTVGDVFDAHAKTLAGAGFGHASLAACGYTMGAMYPPTWMDWPMVWAGNPQVLEPGMVFFLHMILLDDSTGLSMCIGETAIVTDGGVRERVNPHPPRAYRQLSRRRGSLQRIRAGILRASRAVGAQTAR